MELEKIQDKEDNDEITDMSNNQDSSFKFSELVDHKGKQVIWSPDGLFIASYDKDILTIRDREELNVIIQQSMDDKIDYIEWSQDSTLFLVLQKRKNLITVFSINSLNKILIPVGEENIIHASFFPDGTSIIAFSDFQLRTTVYSLNPLKGYIFSGVKNPKTMIAYTEDNSFMILGCRQEAKDVIFVISTKLWKVLYHFYPNTIDMDSITYSSFNKCLTIVDNSLYYNIYIYALNGVQLGYINPYNGAMGCKMMKYSPSSPLMALGGYDECVRIYNTLTWKEQSIHPHDQNSLLDKAAAYKEVSKMDILNGSSKLSLDPEFKEQLENSPGDSYFYAYRNQVDLSIKKLNPYKESQKTGISSLSWSPDGRYIASLSESVSNVVWIWDANRRRLHSILVFIHPVSSIAWCPASLLLAITTSTNMLYIWRPNGICWLQIPEENFDVKTIKWNTDGNALLLINAQHYIISYFN